MTLPKQKANESDANFAARLEDAKRRKRERQRKHYEANKDARREHNRKYYEANKEVKREYARKYRKAHIEARREYAREYRTAHREAYLEAKRKSREAKVLANAKGKPLRSDSQRVQRPKMLTKLILKVAEDFCCNHGFPLESKLDCDVLRHAAKTIRDSPELDGAANPWYGTDFLCPALVQSKHWTQSMRKNWRNKA